ncbi:MAG: hypothetical protein WC723_02890 [Candidatus Omnitrophota bacterium]
MIREGSQAKKAQVTLELATALICIFLLLLASVKLGTWLIGRMVVRQEDYETSRVAAGSTNIGEAVDESDTTRYKNLHFFK